MPCFLELDCIFTYVLLWRGSKLGDESDNAKVKGALLECFLSFPQFRDDLEVLAGEGYLKVTGSETCEWMKSKTSLAEYFKWIGWDAEWVPGGFWAPIENAFGIKRHSLRKLAGNNANPTKPIESRDFMKIKPVLQQHRSQEQRKQNEQWFFRYLKYLILVEAEDEKPETIHKVLDKIYKIFTVNVDKKRQNRR
jgi:hypothetical protein